MFSVLVMAALSNVQPMSMDVGCRGGAGFHPFANLRQRIQDRRAQRTGGGSAGNGCGQGQADSGFAPEQQYTTVEQPFTITTDIPAPAQYKVGAVAVYDGVTWRLVETGAAISIAPSQFVTRPIQAPSVGVIPAGQHAHRTTDGRTIIHGNENMGNAAAHQGIAYPWIRTGEAGQTVYGVGGFGASNCPGGNCPTSNSGASGLFRRR